MILEIFADIEPSTAAGKRRRAFKSKAINMRSNEVSPRKHVVVIINRNDNVATLLIRVQDAHIATLNAAPRQVHVKLRILHICCKMQNKSPHIRVGTLTMYAF